PIALSRCRRVARTNDSATFVRVGATRPTYQKLKLRTREVCHLIEAFQTMSATLVLFLVLLKLYRTEFNIPPVIQTPYFFRMVIPPNLPKYFIAFFFNTL